MSAECPSHRWPVPISERAWKDQYFQRPRSHSDLPAVWDFLLPQTHICTRAHTRCGVNSLATHAVAGFCATLMTIVISASAGIFNETSRANTRGRL